MKDLQVVYNDKQAPQGFYTTNMELITVPEMSGIPAVDELTNGVASKVLPKDYVDNIGNRVGHVTLNRSFALGDVLMLRAAVLYLRTIKDYKIYASTDYHKYGMFIDDITQPHGVSSFNLNLNSYLELDHGTDAYYTHTDRINLILNLFGENASYEDMIWYWPELITSLIDSTVVPNLPEEFVAIQTSGSHPDMKNLGSNTLEQIVNEVTKHSYAVVFGLMPVNMNLNDKAINLSGRTSVADMLTIIHKCKALLTMDSGPLWVSHYEDKPTICFLGPTRAEERMNLHPRHRDGKARVMAMNKQYNCPSCFERMEACKKQANCMSLTYNNIASEFEQLLTEVLQDGDKTA